MYRFFRALFLVGLVALLAGPLQAQPWDTNDAGTHYTGGNVGIGTEWPKAALDVNGYRTHVKTNSSSSPDPLFTSLGAVDARRSVWIRATDNGCNLGGSVLYHITGGWMGGAAPSQRVKVYSLGDNDAYPAVEKHFDVYVSKVGSAKYRLGLNHQGGCDGSSKRVRFVVTASHFNPENTDDNIGNYAKMSVQRYLYQDEGGNVGIGVTDPSKKLAVNGKIRAKEVIVESENWPDYVFEAGYNLRTPTELATFIEQEGHLPALPPAEKVEAEGQTVGEVQRGLVQTVEELARYAIEQRRRVDSLRRANERLHARWKTERRRNDRQDARIDELEARLRQLQQQPN